MGLIVVDVESDGPIPNLYSMVCFGAVNENMETFYGKVKPISDKWNPEALSISGFTREEHLTFDDPKEVMLQFEDWIKKTKTKGRTTFISDNLAYDWQWINYYFHYYLGRNPFGWTGRRIGDLYCGMKHDGYAKWKWMRETKHTHNPVNDAMGNMEVIKKLKQQGLKI